jgi:DNA-binding transcriptional MerR regulator
MTKRYTVTQVERITGIHATCLRIWERRYGWPCPMRDPKSGYRIFTQAEVDDLKRIHALIHKGVDVGTLIVDGYPRFPSKPVAPAKRLAPAFHRVPAPLTPAAARLRQELERAIVANDRGAIAACAARLPLIHPKDRDHAVTRILAVAGVTL